MSIYERNGKLYNITNIQERQTKKQVKMHKKEMAMKKKNVTKVLAALVMTSMVTALAAGCGGDGGSAFPGPGRGRSAGYCGPGLHKSTVFCFCRRVR